MDGLIPESFAQAAGGATGGSQLAPLLMMVLFIVIFYFLLIRPQQKKVKDHQAMVAALRRGDEVVTQGGLIGKITKVKDDTEVEVEVAPGVKIRVLRPTIAQVRSKTEPAND